MNLNDWFWKASISEMKKGYIYDEESDSFICLICGKSFEKGMIYPSDELYMEAEKAAKAHIKAEHVSMFDFLINMDKKFTGLTPHQKELLKLFYDGYSDKEIVDMTGGGSTSTVRNQRFTFREKEKQAKVTLAIMELLNENTASTKKDGKEKFINIHRGATMVDERYATTGAERDTVLKTYFNENKTKLKTFPAREKKKIVVLQYITEQFDSSKHYNEKEVNHILKGFYDDFATIRRYLIEYGFLDRTSDCREYWVKS